MCDLYYYRARYYDPTQGRFISQDPIEFLAGDVNFYRYVGGDPVNWVDPDGLACKELKAIQKRLHAAEAKLAEKLAKVVNLKKIAAKMAAKKLATMPLKAIPLIGWAVAAYDAYDLVSTGIDIKNAIKNYEAQVDVVAVFSKRLAAFF